jgi:hypothetical protein
MVRVTTDLLRYTREEFSNEFNAKIYMQILIQIKKVIILDVGLFDTFYL